MNQTPDRLMDVFLANSLEWFEEISKSSNSIRNASLESSEDNGFLLVTNQHH